MLKCQGDVHSIGWQLQQNWSLTIKRNKLYPVGESKKINNDPKPKGKQLNT